MTWNLSTTLSFLQSFCVDESITQANLIKFIELRYGLIYNKFLNFYQMQRNFSTVSGTKYYYLTKDWNTTLPLKFFNQTDGLSPINVCGYDEILNVDPDESQTGTPFKAGFIELSSVQRQPNETSDTGSLRIKSSSASDTSQKVTITGRATDGTNEFEVTEEQTLNGTTNVSSTYTYVEIYDISKSASTVGYVTVKDSTSTYIYSLIDPYREKSEYQKWRLWPTPDSVISVKNFGHRRPRIPQNDSASIDVPMDILPFFIQGLRSDVHSINFDLIMSKKFDDLFREGLQESINNSTWNDNSEMSSAVPDYRYNPFFNLDEIAEDTDAG